MMAAMVIICRDYTSMDARAHALRSRKLPHQVRKCSGDYQPSADAIQVMSMKVSNGLEFPMVALLTCPANFDPFEA